MAKRKEFWPENEEQLTEYIRQKAGIAHGPALIHEVKLALGGKPSEEMGNYYAASAENAVDATVATFNYMAKTLGLTGFQASWAALTIMATINGWDGPFAVIQAVDMVYPQYNIRAKVEEYLAEWEPWAKEQAAEKLKKAEAEKDDFVHPDVRKHWQKLAAGARR